MRVSYSKTILRIASVNMVFILTILFLLISVLHYIMHQSWWGAARLSFVIFTCGIFPLSIAVWIRDQHKKGSVVFDCGPHLKQWIFFFNAIVFFLLMLHFAHEKLLGNSVVGHIAIGLYYAVLYLSFAFGRLQLCTHGIWIYNSLLKWEHIKSYRWDETVLFVDVRRKFNLAGTIIIKDKQACKTALTAAFTEHGILEDAKV
ncbi:MAG TPA: hypothetical protein VHV83_18880 [Armatimonadota bacterium]|nr:hypothetical protein [Armatimonadota bacterium]